MQAGGGRIRTLADGVNGLSMEVKALREVAPRIDLSKVGPEWRATLTRFTAALEAAIATLGTTNQNLATLANRPFIGMLGGGAEAELQRLLKMSDFLRQELSRVREIVSR